MLSYCISENLRDYIHSFQKPTQAQVLKLVALLEQFGSELRMPYSKQLRPNLYELRIRGKEEIRIFYCFHHDAAVLLHAYKKKSQKMPLKEISHAEKMLKHLKKDSIYAIK